LKAATDESGQRVLVVCEAEAYACQRQLITRLLLVHGMAAVEKAVVNHVKPNREFSLLEMRRFFCVSLGLTGVLFPW
jgi:hypothetical protein